MVCEVDAHHGKGDVEPVVALAGGELGGVVWERSRQTEP
jgi:hypothetical protein